MKFDVVVGNPPFQETLEGTSDAPVYNYFYDLACMFGKKYCLISPARFLFNAGGTSKVWNEKMLNDPHIRVEYYNPEAAEVFKDTGFKGGVAVLYRDEFKNFGPIGTFTKFPLLNEILTKVTCSDNFESIVPMVTLQEKFDLKKLYTDYPELESLIGSKGREKRLTTSIFNTVPSLFHDHNNDDYNIEILGLIDNKRVYKFINSQYIVKKDNLNSWKVVLPKSNGTGLFGEKLSNPIIGRPGLGHTQSFISFGKFDSSTEANNLLKYLKSKFCRALLGAIKITQDNNPATWAKVPVQNFSNDSNIDWTKAVSEIDHQLYMLYRLNQSEIDFIESKVKPMD
ncbi:Eco57I restriction-modification methylase domain-containing protein [Lactiplantibacillus sp. WILCCON 0030]|uniref:Eco57I restriction-modification methylase domain-containing protein n=1 Tax=Lactiplantibacillus brownii TaxID=3069269 RepID=A0ABU1A731_9LACO|nr:Eco57I restriction-modification methylase domain-containing protein [Lactiplantibacillus brownii]MDQ7936756.1 Eco57I restriction-modification methylase domain-containing protein [Lactiplantibacillus brownii]